MLLHRLALFLVAILLTLYIWGNSQSEAAGLVPPPWDKLLHLFWYAVLAVLLLLELGRWPWPWVLVGLLLLAGWDEWHQFSLPGRSPGIDDWLADVLGVMVGIGVSLVIGRCVRAASAR